MELTSEVRRSLELFASSNGVVEIRALHCWDGNPDFQSTRSGYFDHNHFDDATRAVEELEGRYHASGVYITMNPVNPALLARAANRIKKALKNETTADADIVCRHWILVDVDPSRPAGVSSTDAELAEAKAVAIECGRWLADGGFPLPVIAMSGNGWHLLYRVELPATDKRVEQCLKAVHAKFPLVDASNFNAARITKLYGTLARKGDSTPDRPHRRSELVEVPEIIEPVPIDRLDWLASQAPVKQQQVTSAGDSGSVDIGRYLQNRSVPVLSEDVWNGSRRWFIDCPGKAAHTTVNSDTDCSIWQDPAGMISAKCFHNSCQMHDWATIRDALGPVTADDFPPRPLVDIGDFFSRESPIDVSPNSIDSANESIDDDDEPSLADETVNDVDFPEECLRPPGLMSDLISYTLGTARYPQPIHAFAGSVALMSLLTGRRVRDTGNTRTNLMIVALGPSRSGKDYPREVISTILGRVGASAMYEEKLASNAALHGFLQKSNAGILMSDEFGDWLATARSKSGPNTQPAQILTSLLKLYSSSGYYYKADRYADNSKQVEIDQPHFVLYATSTGEVFWKHVTPEYLSGGLFGRVILLENCGYVLPRSIRERQVLSLDPIVEEVRAWLNTHPANDFCLEHPQPIIVPHSSDALDRFEAHEMTIAKRRVGEDAIRAALWSGTAEITAKLSLLFACSRSRNPLQIQIEDVELVVRLSNWLTRRKVSLCGDHVAENATEEATKRVYRMIKSGQKNGIGRYELTRKTQWLKPREREETINTLIQSGQISLMELKTRTKTKTVFVSTIHVPVENIISTSTNSSKA